MKSALRAPRGRHLGRRKRRPDSMLRATESMDFSAVIVRGATVLAAASLGFWTGSPQNSAMHVVHNRANFAQFPLSIYGRGLQAVLTFGVPFAFVSYYPAAWLFAKEQIGWIGLLTPLVGVYGLLAARWLFQRGVRRYESAGN